MPADWLVIRSVPFFHFRPLSPLPVPFFHFLSTISRAIFVPEDEPEAMAWFIQEFVRGTATAKQEGARG